MMLLAIDIGNTNISVGLFKGKRLIRKASYGDRSQLSGIVSGRDLSPYIKNVDKVIIVSVAPKRLKEVLRILKRIYRKKIYIIGKDIKVPLKSHYNPKEIGQDRLVTAYAASIVYGTPVLTIDFGTAVTFDVVSKQNLYVGGLILPGIKMSLESLHKKTAFLPEVEFKKAKEFIGKNTKDSIRSGMVYGYVSICEGLIKRFKKKFRALKVVATGGDAKLISNYTSSIQKVDENLSLKGISMLQLPC